MKADRIRLLLAWALLSGSQIGTPLMAQTPPPATAPAATLDAAARKEIVAKLAEGLRERYVFPDVGARAAAKIDAALAAGEYDMLADPSAFTARLSADVAAIAHDKHLRVWSTMGPPPHFSGGTGPRPRSEAGITRADKLAGGIGYLEVVGFPPATFFKPVIDQAMLGLKGSRALILDARRNGGGDPKSVAYLVSFLVTPGRPINDIVIRTEKTQSFTRQNFLGVPTPLSFAGVPVYVLTSHDTFSGGEEFAYDIQSLKRGPIVGEVTGGGANPTSMIDLGHQTAATIPFGRAESPVTKTNWEGRGVQPDFAVPAADALKVALQKLGHRPAADIAEASVEQVFTPRSTPRPGADAALRHMLDGFASGRPDYAAMEPQFAAVIRQAAPKLQADFAPLGEIRSLKFQDVDAMGADRYEVTFAKGVRIAVIQLGPNGEVLGIYLPPPAAMK